MLDIPDQAVSVAPVVVAAVRYLAHPHVGLRVHVVPASKVIIVFGFLLNLTWCSVRCAGER